MIRIANSLIELKKNKNLASLETVYGIGRVRATKISQFLLTNPRAKEFKTSLIESSQELRTQRIFKAIKTDNSLRLIVYSNLEKLARIGCYKARRILQNLPSNGQRTHTNAGTPNNLNPFVSLLVNSATTKELLLANKKWELAWNNRSSDITDLRVKGTKYSKAASLAKKKKVKEKILAKKKKALGKKSS